MPRQDRTRVAPIPPDAGPDGYTLVELIVVVMVLAALGAYAAPRFFDQSVFTQRGYADELASALRAARKAAVASDCPAQLVLAAGSYSAVQQAASGNSCNTADTTWATPVLGADGSPIAGTAPANTTASPTGTFQFDTNGALAASPGTTLTIGSRTLTIDAGSGLVTVQ